MSHAVLLLAYGAPDSLDDVEPFYTDIRRGRKPPPELLEELLDRYRRIGGKSPLLEITRRQADALARALDDGTRVFVGMRHWKPWIRDTLREMAAAGVVEAEAVVLAPHYSSLSIAAYMRLLDEANAALPAPIALRKIESWHLQPALIEALARRVERTRATFTAAERDALRIVFTAHSLPAKILATGDPYPAQLLATSQAIAGRLGLSDWQVGYQSAGRTPEPWLGPDLLAVIDAAAAAGRRALLVCVIGFVADHLEVLYDIDIEARAHAQARGIRLERIPMLNDAPELAAALAAAVQAARERPGGDP